MSLRGTIISIAAIGLIWLSCSMETVCAQVTGYVIKVDGSLVYLDVGKDDQVSPGSVFTVHGSARRGYRGSGTVGIVKVSQVFPKVSVGHFVKRRGGSQVKVFDRATADTGAGIPESELEATFAGPKWLGRFRPFLPGAERLVSGDTGKGLALAGGTLASIAGAIAARQVSDRAYNDYLVYMEHYSPRDASNASSALSRANGFRSVSNGLFMIAGSVYLYNVLDGYALRWRYPSFAIGEDLGLYIACNLAF